MSNITENIRENRITVSLHEKNNIYQAVINYKDENNKRKQKWVSTGIKVARGNKKIAQQKAEELKQKFEYTHNLSKQIEQENDKDKQKLLKIRSKLQTLKLNDDDIVDENILFLDYLERWLEKARHQIEITTYVSYHYLITAQLTKFFTKNPIKLLDVEPIHIKSLHDFILEQGLTPNTVLHYHAFVRKALDYACTMEIIPTNPADKVKRPKANQYIGSFYSEKELNTLFESSKGDPLELIILITAFYGLRRSEVLGLKWDAFDLEQKTITIKHTIVELNIDGKRKIIGKDRTKNKSSYRTLPLVDEVIEPLKQAKEQQALFKKAFRGCYTKKYEEYVFVNPVGKLIRPDYVSEHFRILLKNFNLRKIRFHDLRHSCASLLLARGIPMKAIQEWLGHSNFSTTANIYAHLDTNSKKLSAQAMADIINKRNNTSASIETNVSENVFNDITNDNEILEDITDEIKVKNTSNVLSLINV